MKSWNEDVSSCRLMALTHFWILKAVWYFTSYIIRRTVIYWRSQESELKILNLSLQFIFYKITRYFLSNYLHIFIDNFLFIIYFIIVAQSLKIILYGSFKILFVHNTNIIQTIIHNNHIKNYYSKKYVICASLR